MKILQLYIRGFGKLKNYQIDFDNNINVIYGKNEAGKSTIHSFIKAMLYGMQRSRGKAGKYDLFTKYEPWDNPDLYGGYMKILYKDKVYTIDRNLKTKGKKSLIINNETDALQLDDPQTFLYEITSGLSETCYMNTISIGQMKNTTDSGMINELKNHIANLNNTANENINIKKADDYLKNKKKEFSSLIDKNAPYRYASLSAKEKELSEKINGYTNKDNINSLKNQKIDISNAIQRKSVEYEFIHKSMIQTAERLNSSGYNCKNTDDIQKSYELINSAYKNLAVSFKKYKGEYIKKQRINPLIFIFLILFLPCIALHKNITYLLSLPETAGKIILYSACFIVLLTLIFTFIKITKNIRAKKKIIYLKSCLDNSIRLIDKEFYNDSILSPEEYNIQKFVNILSQSKKDLSGIKKDLFNLNIINNEINNLNNSLTALDEEIYNEEKNNWLYENYIEEKNNLSDEIYSVKNIINKNEKYQKEIDAIDLALEKLNYVSLNIGKSFGVHLNKAASENIRKITDGKYESISLDNELNIYLNTDSKLLIPLFHLSIGTIDQIYLALRMATAKFLIKGNDFPILFDDSFVNYDLHRLKSSFKFLYEQNLCQTIIFTCHKRESDTLNKLNIKYKLIEINN